MRTRYWIITIVALLLLGAVLYYAAYAYSLKQVSIKDAEFNLAELSLKGAKLHGDVILQNDGLIGVTIDEVEVEVRSGTEKIASAIVDGGKIPAGGDASYPVEIGIDWIPTAQAAIDLLQSENKELAINGKVKFGVHRLWFEKKIDLTEYLLQFTTIKILDKVPNAKKAAQEVNQQLKKMLG